MGLDAYLFATNAKLSKEVDFYDELNDRRVYTVEELVEHGYSQEAAERYANSEYPPFETTLKPGVEKFDVHYFRKHHDLHGWMADLYKAKNGAGESFNCDPVALSSEDLDRLEADVRDGTLPNTSGFFFGQGNTFGYKEETLQCITKLREHIAQGHTVFYDSWW